MDVTVGQQGGARFTSLLAGVAGEVGGVFHDVKVLQTDVLQRHDVEGVGAQVGEFAALFGVAGGEKQPGSVCSGHGAFYGTITTDDSAGSRRRLTPWATSWATSWATRPADNVRWRATTHAAADKHPRPFTP